MGYCPICNELLKPGTVCTCGWDPSCDYEHYLSLVPVRSGTLSRNAQSRQYRQKLLDAQRKAYEAKIEEMNKRQNAFEKQLKKLTRRIEVLEAAPHSDRMSIPAGQKMITQAQPGSNPSGAASKYRNLKKGDVISFGQYWQGKNLSAGKTAIQWRVLAKEGSRALLISKYGLDAKPYNKGYKQVIWETCSLRSWLNHDFYDAAFSAEEKQSILTTTVTADANPEYRTNPGSDTKDKLFLLSIPEAEKYFASGNDRRCAPTAYALAQGAYVSDGYKTAEGEACCWCWLRSPGDYQNYAAYVDCGGSVNYHGSLVGSDNVCVRPALWINLES